MLRFAFAFVCLTVIVPVLAQAETAPAAPAAAPAAATPAPAAPSAAPAAPAAAAAPAIIDKISRSDMIALLQQDGLTQVSDRTTDEAAPWVAGTTKDGILVVVQFYDCDAGVTGSDRACRHFTFGTTWNNTKNLDAKAVNAYNEQKVFGRGVATSDGKYVYIDYAVNLDGGVTRNYIVQNFNYYLVALNDFISIVKPY